MEDGKKEIGTILMKREIKISTAIFFQILAFILFFVIPFKTFALECNITVTGAGTTAYNGTYTDTGTTLRGYPVFTNGTQYLNVNNETYDPALQYWMFSDSPYGDQNRYYKSFATGRFGEYTVNYIVDPPAPTATEACGGGGGGATSTVSGIIDFANTSFASTTGGFTFPIIANWLGENLLKGITGGVLGTVKELRYWLVSILILFAIIMFTFRAFKILPIDKL